MELIKLEFVAFLEQNVSLGHSDIPLLMEQFSWIELLPQFIQETNLATQAQTKIMSLTNQISGFSIVFNTDKLLISQDIRSDSATSFEELMNRFNKDVIDCLEKLGSTFYKERTFKRFALVTTGIQIVTEAQKSIFVDRVCSSLSDSTDHIELKLRYTHRKTLDEINEPINFSIMINDGIYEKNEIKTGIATRTSCFLIQTDFNTLDEISSHRFSIDNIKVCFDSLVQSTISNLKSILSKF
ncbi:hypothetical protein [Shewanella sp. DAU305]|uniref:hypothetical protein n=1 Tax=Shewanella sp. DAU305 TaxID=2991940 RepID=UPI0022837FCD|nr:hypothetical protein [Shewanella sp. DAU305]WAL79822.1 hypothetical protein OX890_06660 [Shewanella sp. DAU305]